MSDANKSEDEQGLLSVIVRGDLLVLSVAALLLLGGWVVRSQHVDGTTGYRGHGVACEYPRGWSVAEPGAGAALITDLLAAGRESFLPRITVVDEHLPQEIKAGPALEDYLRLDLQRSLVLYHSIARAQVAVPGAATKGVRLDYAHAINPATAGPGVTDVPVVIRGATVAFAAKTAAGGARLRRVTVELSLALHQRQPGLIDHVLASVKGVSQ